MMDIRGAVCLAYPEKISYLCRITYARYFNLDDREFFADFVKV